MAGRESALFYGHFSVVPGMEQPIVIQSKKGVPEDIWEELHSHKTKVIADYVKKGDITQYTIYLIDGSYRITAIDREVRVVRLLSY